MNRIRELRLANGFKSQQALANKLYVNQTAVSQWERDITLPDNQRLIKLSELFNCSTDYILGVSDDKKATSSKNTASLRIPVLGSVPAGIPIEAIEDVIGFEDVPSSWGNGGREYFALQVNGDSMYPEYLDGDIVIVRKQSVADTGDDVVIYVNGYDATLKRLRLNPDGSLSIIPINPQYAPRTFTPEEIQAMPVSIAGVVVELRRTKKR